MTQLINTNENTNRMQIFENSEFGKIRIIDYENEPYFIAQDISEILEYTETSTMLRRLDDDEKIKIASTFIAGANNMSRDITIISESGIYNAILGSKKPEAKKFKKWITSEVLPTIRKTGGFVSNSDMFINTYLPFADDNTKMLFKQTLTVIEQQNKVIQEQKPKVEYFNAIVDRKLNVSFRDCAKQIAVPERKFIAWLEEEKYIFRQYRINSKGKEVSVIKPYAQYVPSLFEIKDFAVEHKAGVQTLITPKGKETFRLLTEHLRK